MLVQGYKHGTLAVRDVGYLVARGAFVAVVYRLFFGHVLSGAFAISMRSGQEELVRG